MTTNELLIGLGGLILCVLTYFGGVVRTKRQFEHDDCDTRINRVVEKYLPHERSVTTRTNSLNALIIAGVWTLKNNLEIREACQRIVNHGEKNPLPPYVDFEGKDLFIFFSAAKNRGLDFFKKGDPIVLARELWGEPK